MRWMDGLALAALAAAAPAFGQQAAAAQGEAVEAAAPAAESLADRVKAVLDGYKQAGQDFGKAYGKATTDEERREIINTLRPQPGDYAQRLMAIALEDPADPGAAKALAWVMQQSDDDDAVAKAAELMLAHHLDSEALVESFTVFEHQPNGGRAFLEAVAEATGSDEVRTRAKYSLAMHLLERASVAESLAEKSEDDRGGYISFFGQDLVTELLAVDPTALKSEAEGLLNHVVEAGGDLKHPRRGTMKEACAIQLFELRNLQVGMQVPDITGADLDGVEFSLSDYKGKVIVLDFWGNW